MLGLNGPLGSLAHFNAALAIPKYVMWIGLLLDKKCFAIRERELASLAMSASDSVELGFTPRR